MPPAERRGALSGRRIALVTTSISRLGGGVAEAVRAQARLIDELGGEPLTFALRDAWSDEDRTGFAGASLTLLEGRGPALLAYAPGLIPALEASRADLLHLHGIWQYPSRASTCWARGTGRSYIISPHGMLDPWINTHGRWKKALARTGYERASWRRADALHALTEFEAHDIERETGRADAVVIPNPAPPATPVQSKSRAKEMLYLGRIHPKKNLRGLVEAWQLLAAQDRLAGARLTIAGWGAPGEIAALEAQLATAPSSARFIGPVHGEAKRTLLAAARFLILPSFGEGLPMAVLEAWAEGTPTIMTAQCNLPEGFAAEAAIECTTTPDSIAEALATGLSLGDAEWLAMARSSYSLAFGQFSREQVALAWEIAYSTLIEHREGLHNA